MKTLIQLSITFIIIVIFLFLITIGIDRQIKHECLVWEEQSKTYPNFYWTPSQIDQCHPISIQGTNIPYRNDNQKYNQYDK